MAGKRHLFLTGEKQVGKSTLLRELIRREGLSCSGFETRPLMADGVRRGFLLHSLLPMPPYENDCVISVRLGERRSVPVLPAFEENGVAMLRRSLDSGRRVLGVLQCCDAPLVRQIAAREDVLLLTVTPENREQLPPLLAAWAIDE